MISALFGVRKQKQQQQQEPHRGVLRFDQRVLEQSQRTTEQRNVQVDPRLVELILSKIELSLNELVGQPVEISQLTAQLKQQANDYLASLQFTSTDQIERALIETKEKYNELVDTLNTNRTRLREFHDGVFNSLQNLTLVMAQLLNSKEFEQPMKNIRRGINEMSVETVEKHMGLIGKFLAHEHAKTLQQALNKKEVEHNEEVRVLKASLRGQEIELSTLKESRSLFERQLKDQQTSKKELAERLKHAEQSLKLSEQLNSQTNKDKYQQAEKDLQQKSRQFEQKIRQLEATCKQHISTNQALHTRIESLEALLKQEQLNTKLSCDLAEKKYTVSIRKLSQQKLHLEDRNAQLQAEIKKLKFEQSINIDNALKENSGLTSVLQDRVARLDKEISLLTQEKQQLQQKLKGMVEREVLKDLMEGYMDEGKAWEVKGQIRQKLFQILGIKQHQPEPAPKKGGWFIFN